MRVKHNIDSGKVKIFTGNSVPGLAKNIATKLNLPLGKATVNRFSDGEINVELLENVRGCDVFLLQSTCAPTNDNLMELVIMADALRRASANRITAVIPYFGYARQDRRVRSARVPISAKIVADMLTAVGITRVVTVDLHADQIQGFFYHPVDNIYASPLLIKEILSRNYHNPMVVSPDVGGVVRARAFAKGLNDCELAIIDKRRPSRNETKVMHIIGDVRDKTCILIDDIVDTASTLCNAVTALKDCGAKSVVAYCTHPVLSGPALSRISNSGLEELVVTDTLKLGEEAKNNSKIKLVSIADTIAESIHRIYEEDSLSSMFI